MGLPFVSGYRDLRELRRFLAQKPEDRRIVFYAEDAASWVHFEAIIRELTEIHRQPICYLTSAPDDPVLARKDEMFLPFCIGDGSARTLLFRTLRADILVMTMPDLETFHIKRSVYPVHYIYVFHSINSTHVVYLKAAFDHFDTLFCVGPHHVAEIRETERVYGLRKKTLIEHGYGRLDAILGSGGQNTPKPLPNGRRRVLVAPSWAPQGLLETPVGSELIEAVLKAGHHVTVRPHPMTRRKAPQALDSLYQRFSGTPWFCYEEDVASQKALYDSDLMVSDWSGVATEYAFGLGRPVLFVDTPRKVRNKEYEKIRLPAIEESIRTEIGTVIAPNEVGDAPKWVERLCAEEAGFKQKIRESRSRWIYNIGRSGTVGAEYIIDLAKTL